MANPHQGAELRIAQINLGRGKIASADLLQEAEENKYDLALIQEPYVWDERVLGLGSRNRTIWAGKHPWACIVVFNQEVDVMLIHHLSDENCTCVQITGPSGHIYAVSMYCKHDANIQRDCGKIQNIINSLGHLDVILGLDSNARSRAWGEVTISQMDSRHAIARGVTLLESIAANRLIIANRLDQPSSFWTKNGESNIDVSIYTVSLAGRIRNWRVRIAAIHSDHRLIEFGIVTGPHDRVAGTRTPYYNTKRADWESFGANIKSEIQNLEWVEGVDHQASQAENILLRATKGAIPRKKAFSASCPWWNPSLTRTKKQVYNLRRRSQKKGLDPVEKDRRVKEYQGEARNYAHQVEKAKKTSWRSFVSEEGNRYAWGGVYKVLTNKIPAGEVMHSIKNSNGEINDWEGAATELLTQLVPDNLPDERDEAMSMDPTENPGEVLGEDVEPWTVAEVKSAVRYLPPNKAPGKDKITGTMVKEACKHGFVQVLLVLYNACLTAGTFPKEWKDGLIRALLKNPRKDPTIAGSYRPVCLLPVLGKTLERLIKWRLAQVFGEKWASDAQWGFRIGRSTEGAICQLRKVVSASRQPYVIAIFLDIKGAFNNLWWPLVLRCLRRRACPRNIYNLVRSYLSDRTATIEGKQHRVSKKISKGCPQGSVLGPDLWNLVLDELLHQIQSIMDTMEDRGSRVVAYADDLALIISGESSRDLERKCTIILNKITEWCEASKLEIAPEKSEWIFAKGDLKRNPTIKIGNKNIRKGDSVRYLGVHFGKKLNIEAHISKISDKCNVLFNKFGAVSKATWGLKYKCMKTLYTGIFVPVITYASAGWGDKLTGKLPNKLLTAQRNTLLRVTQAYRTTSHEALHILAGEIPIDLLVRERMGQYNIRVGEPYEYKTFSYTEGMDKEEAKEKLRKVVLEEWDKNWKSSVKGRITARYFSSVEDRLSASWVKPDHYVSQFITGHGDFRAKLAQFHLVESDLCECGGEDTPEHILRDCPQFTTERDELREWGEFDHWPPNEGELVSKGNFKWFRKFARRVLGKRNELRQRA